MAEDEGGQGLEGGRAGLEVRRKGMSKVKKRSRKETGKRRLKNIKINAGACASGLPSPDDSVVDLSLHGRG